LIAFSFNDRYSRTPPLISREPTITAPTHVPSSARFNDPDEPCAAKRAANPIVESNVTAKRVPKSFTMLSSFSFSVSGVILIAACYVFANSHGEYQSRPVRNSPSAVTNTAT
jgi:hypothetical protein